jgi:murein DD-endopeptidase MepM/ murein hydrolase activator NlpD
VRQAPPRPTVQVRYFTAGRVVTPNGMYRDYEVRRGDHIDAIARDLQTTRRELIEANDLEAPYRVRPGRHLRIPVSKAYEARNGDTMATVAKRFGVNVNELADLNDLPARNRLTNGTLIALPAHFEDHGPTRETQEVYAAAVTRPQATYRSARAPEPYASGAYVPSQYALAAAAARRSQMATNTYNPPAARYPIPNRLPEGGATQATIVNAGQGRFAWPVRGEIITAFGMTGVGRRNDGVDIRSPAGTEVRAAAAGEVVYAGNQVPGFGNLVLIKHADGWVSAYAHLAEVSVRMRQTVYQGQQVGFVGITGGVSEPQLHFEIRYAPTPADKAKPLDPLLVLPKDTTAHAAAGRPGA